MWELTPMIVLMNSILNPLKTETTIIKTETLKNKPKKAIKEATDGFLDFLKGKMYLSPINSDWLEFSELLKEDLSIN